MSMKKCKECKGKVSSKAKICPHCGAPMPKGTSSFTWLIVILGALIIFSNVTEDNGMPQVNSYDVAPQEDSPEEQERRERIRKRIEADTAAAYEEFTNNKEKIIAELKALVKNGEYQKVLDKTKMSFAKKDPDIVAIRNKVTELKIVAVLKTIPASQAKRNMDSYARLMKLNPDEPLYEQKHTYYKGQLEVEAMAKLKARVKKDKERQDRVSKFGEPPKQSSWDGSYLAVEKYLKKIAHDPDSLDMDGCTEIHHSKDGWLVGCDYRAKNAFGGYVRQTNWFTIRHGQVIMQHEADAFSVGG